MRKKIYLERLLLNEKRMEKELTGVDNTQPLAEYLVSMLKVLDQNLIAINRQGREKNPFFHSTIVLRDVVEELISGGSIYTIGERFGIHLAKTKLDVPCKYLLTDKKPLYIEFPESVSFPREDFSHTCAMVSFGTSKKDGRDLLMILLPDDFGEGDDNFRNTYYYMPLDTEKTISESIDELEDYLGVGICEAARGAISFVAKSILYIKSGEPDLIDERVKYPTSKNPKKIKTHWRNFSPFNLTRVGYNFHRKYSVDSTMVSGHFRWQPYGHMRQQLKLIWIDEHEREYNKS